MVDFPSGAASPTAPLNKNKKFRILSANFGDGYTQRTGDGLNTEIESFTVTWDVLTESEKDTIADFFDARGGSESFNYTMHGDDTEKKWIVPEYKVIKITAAHYRIEASFERVYDL